MFTDGKRKLLKHWMPSSHIASTNMRAPLLCPPTVEIVSPRIEWAFASASCVHVNIRTYVSFLVLKSGHLNTRNLVDFRPRLRTNPVFVRHHPCRDPESRSPFLSRNECEHRKTVTRNNKRHATEFRAVRKLNREIKEPKERELRPETTSVDLEARTLNAKCGMSK